MTSPERGKLELNNLCHFSVLFFRAAISYNFEDYALRVLGLQSELILMSALRGLFG